MTVRYNVRMFVKVLCKISIFDQMLMYNESSCVLTSSKLWALSE